MKPRNKIKKMTSAGFKKMYMANTVNETAALLGCSRGNVLYHAKKQGITGIKKSGCVRKVGIGNRLKARP